MNKKLILILLFFFALFTPLVFNSPSIIYEVFAGGPIAPTPFGPGPVVPPGGNVGGSGTTIPQSTPVAGQALSGLHTDGTVDRMNVQLPLPTATPTAGNAINSWNGSAFTVTPIQAPLPTATPTAGKALNAWNGSAFTETDVQAPLPTATPTANSWVTSWNGSAFTVSRPVCADLSDAVASCSTDTTDATNITTGTLPNTVLDPSVTKLGAKIDLDSDSEVNGLLDVTHNGTGCAGTDCKTDNRVSTTNTLLGTYDFSGAAEASKMLPVINGTAASVAWGVIYINSADGLIHYGNNTTDTAIDNVAAAAIVTSITPGSDYALTTVSGVPKRILASNLEVGKADKDVGTQEKCVVVDNLVAGDDNMFMGAFAVASTVTGVWCSCKGTCTGTLPTFTLHHGTTGGQAMTITGTNPTCTAAGTTPTIAAVTAYGSLDAYEDFAFDVTNSPTILTDTYMICVSFVRN